MLPRRQGKLEARLNLPRFAARCSRAGAQGGGRGASPTTHSQSDRTDTARRPPQRGTAQQPPLTGFATTRSPARIKRQDERQDERHGGRQHTARGAGHAASPQLPAEEGIAGLDVFGDTPQGPRPGATSRLPAAPNSTPIPLPLGHITTSQPSVAPSDARVASKPTSQAPSHASAPRAPTSASTDSRPGASWDPREASPTGQVRAAARQDVARRALHELGVLGRELEALPDWLEQSGLVGIHQRGYREATWAYLELAQQAWEGVAEERLEQSGDEAEYRARALDVARRIKHMQEESQAVLNNPEFHLSSRRPLFWKRRVGFVRAGLAAWMSALAAPADPYAMGQALLQLRAAVGLANAGTLELGLFGTLVAGINALGFVLALGLALLQVPTILAGDTTLDTALVAYLVVAALVWVLALTLALGGGLPLRTQLATTLFAPQHSVRLARRGSLFVAGLLRGWTDLILLVGALGSVWALAQSALWLRGHVTTPLPHDLPAQAQLLGGSLVTLAAPAGGALVAALALVALPLLLLNAGRFTVELAQNPSWAPAARRAALRPASGVLAFLTAGLVVAVYALTTAAGLADHARALLIVLTPPFDGYLTWRAALLFAAIVAPYLLLIDLPYRIGVLRYKQRWLADLATRRATLESHMRWLSVRDPRSGQQDVSEENLNAMQYDLILLQFYRAKIEEAERIRSTPFSLQRVLGFLILAALVALALENADALLTLLQSNRDALLHLLPGR